MLNESPPVSGRRQARDERRNQILATALAEFTEKGFHGASTRSITTAAGISSGLLFHYFASKEALFTELIRIGTAEFALDATGDPLDNLRRAAQQVLGMLRDNPAVARMFVLMAWAELHPGITAEADRLLAERDLVRATAPIVEAGQRAGTIRAGNPQALALAFWSALQGIGESVAAQPDTPLPEADWLVDIVREPSRGRG